MEVVKWKFERKRKPPTLFLFFFLSFSSNQLLELRELNLLLNGRTRAVTCCSFLGYSRAFRGTSSWSVG